jgi:hypothetical protein
LSGDLETHPPGFIHSAGFLGIIRLAERHKIDLDIAVWVLLWRHATSCNASLQ